ncbi:3-deoxy-manno-octulosonate cytidylyltransferase (CMP-KDO synthetase) [Albimonas donghaensis]|uniref:3-deoxy-manno-octulosonate cytidylyltransferase (CMP-KDO synthetase) n=1 Tax=Albimonas donghaensis TaxID=356660 RepID=A0A1H2TSG6_9RHOB|nr:manno-octulosonate cytidylyltransferase [Albimonas donghaensis]SDW46876.1 3-deoxy-manno-octulosonate cytidylyltransferase (CMP-KDO synthetase) [Albimonas donghaensis]
MPAPRAAIVIPARYKSSRFPGKPLQALRGADGVSKSLIQRAWEAGMAAQGFAEVVVATDDARIAEAAEGFGARVVMTPESCRNGTERCAAALPMLESDPEVIVNLQGDAPLTPPWFLEALRDAMADQSFDVATPVLRCDAEAHAAFLEDRAAGRVGGTTAVFDRSGRALYFSKEVIPYTGRTFAAAETCPVFHHVGVYAYRPGALAAYAGWPEGGLETWEGLEQLRFLENGVALKCVEVEARGRVFWEVNNPQDVARVESAMERAGIL